MVELARLARGSRGRILAKLEYLNPGLSKKDRIARQIIEDAEADGSLRPRQTVVELTSGNTGTGLAIVCAVKGYPFVAVMSRGNSAERARMMRALGAEVVLVAPPTLLPVAVGSWPCSVGYDLDAALPKADVVMMLRVQQERMSAAFFPTVREYRRRYGLDTGRMALLPEHAIVMHPGPMNRGVEIAAQVADSPRSTIVAQVANGVTVRMAVLYLMLGGATEETL